MGAKANTSRVVCTLRRRMLGPYEQPPPHGSPATDTHHSAMVQWLCQWRQESGVGAVQPSWRAKLAAILDTGKDRYWCFHAHFHGGRSFITCLDHGPLQLARFGLKLTCAFILWRVLAGLPDVLLVEMPSSSRSRQTLRWPAPQRVLASGRWSATGERTGRQQGSCTCGVAAYVY